MELKFDHIIHYIDQLERFQFPGKLLKLHSGGKHHKFGTFNQLSYINGNYIEMLDVEDKEKLKKLAKSEEDAYHLPLRLYKITLFKVLKLSVCERMILSK